MKTAGLQIEEPLLSADDLADSLHLSRKPRRRIRRRILHLREQSGDRGAQLGAVGWLYILVIGSEQRVQSHSSLFRRALTFDGNVRAVASHTPHQAQRHRRVVALSVNLLDQLVG